MYVRTVSPNPGNFPYDPRLVGKSITQIKRILGGLKCLIEPPQKLKLDELTKFATEHLQAGTCFLIHEFGILAEIIPLTLEPDSDLSSELSSLPKSGSKDGDNEAANNVPRTRTGGGGPIPTKPLQTPRGCYNLKGMRTPGLSSTSGPQTRSSSGVKTPGKAKSPVVPASNTTPTNHPAPRTTKPRVAVPSDPVSKQTPAKQPRPNVNKSLKIWRPGMPLVFQDGPGKRTTNTTHQANGKIGFPTAPYPPPNTQALTTRKVLIIDIPVDRCQSEPLTPSRPQDQSPGPFTSRPDSGRTSPIRIDIMSCGIPTGAAPLVMKPEDMQILTTIDFSQPLLDDANSGMPDIAPAIYMDAPLDDNNLPIPDAVSSLCMTNIAPDIYSDAPLDVCNIPIPHSVLQFTTPSPLPKKKEQIGPSQTPCTKSTNEDPSSIQDNHHCKSDRDNTINKACVPMDVDTDYHQAPIDQELGLRAIDDIFQWLDKDIKEEKLQLQSPPPKATQQPAPLAQQPETHLPSTPPTCNFGSASFEFWVPAYTRQDYWKLAGCSISEPKNAHRTDKPNACPFYLPKIENVSFPEIAPPLRLPTAVEQDASSPPSLPKAKEDASNGTTPLALPQLPEAGLEYPAAGDEAASDPVTAPAIPKENTADPETNLALSELPGADPEIPTAVEQDPLCPPSLPKAEEDASDSTDPPALSQLPEAGLEDPTAGDEAASDPMTAPAIPKENAADPETNPALPELSEADPEIPTALKQDALAPPSLPKAEEEGSNPAFPTGNLTLENFQSLSTKVMESESGE
ncbi:hypothetical protein PtA15_7A391 [Puccinia triticina]|uniref:Uncharacterized protein n=1 Tax=Puccinia triticina TaxID=208348 RepID=A0ABY7CN65_9BASI|nr:uncharacterized protein PtA15_7A391 [Puccinia triticina]WAQ86663.1 hypothetical protein PtA15_7A391 [Puccinia triticina]